MLKYLKISEDITLIEATNNPIKIQMLTNAGYNVTSIHLQISPKEISQMRTDYQLELSIKQRLGHEIRMYKKVT